MECPVDVPETGHSQVKPRVGRPTDDYADVPDMFRSLAAPATAPEGVVQHASNTPNPLASSTLENSTSRGR